MYCLCSLCYSVCCLFVNVYCSTATRYEPNSSYQVYHIVSYYINISYVKFYISENSRDCQILCIRRNLVSKKLGAIIRNELGVAGEGCSCGKQTRTF